MRFDRNDYTIPPTHVRRTLTVVARPTEVRVLDGAAVIAAHPRSYDKDKQVEDPAHIAELTARKRVRNLVVSPHKLDDYDQLQSPREDDDDDHDDG